MRYFFLVLILPVFNHQPRLQEDILWIDRFEARLSESWQNRHVLVDGKRFYRKKKVISKKVPAIVIMTDSDNTQTPSSADYDDLFFSKN